MRHSPKLVMDTFDESDFLREFDNLQPVDIMAQAIDLSLIPADSNNNNDQQTPTTTTKIY